MGRMTAQILSQELVNQLRYLVERLIVGVSIGGYEDLEDSTHKFHIGTIGPRRRRRTHYRRWEGGCPVQVLCDPRQSGPTSR